MKRKSLQKSRGDLLCAPVYPHTGHQLFQQLCGALGDTVGFRLTYPYLGRVIGESAKVAHYWFHAMPQTQLIAFLSLLERLPEKKREAVINKCCRELPSIENPRLAHDPLAVSNLEKLISQGSGLTWVQNGTEFQQTFLLNAMGHSFFRITGGRQTVAGIDIHEPRHWVPVERIIYLREPLPPARMKKAILEAWPVARSSKARVLLLNGIWMAAPELRGEILEETMKRHVIVTVSKIPESRELRTSMKIPVHAVSIGQPRENEKWLRIKVEAL